MSERLPLLSGSYSSRSLIANAQVCVNLLPEANPQETTPPVGVTQLLMGGSVLVAEPALGSIAAVRCLYRSTIDIAFICIGNSVYWMDGAFGSTFMGVIANANTPVSISDNGIIGVLVDGTGAGYWWDLATKTFHTIVDAAFYGANRVCYLDGYFVFNLPLTSQFYLSPVFWNGTDPFDPTYIASKTGGADRIVSIAVIRGELWLLGAQTSEVWFNAGGADFPFQRQPGVFIDHGMQGGWSVSENDVEVFWLGRDKEGRCIVLQGKGYEAVRRSNFGVENAIQSYAVVNDSVGFVMQVGGHTFYVLSFPTADKTWVLDVASGEWFEWNWTGDGGFHRTRANCYCFTNNSPLIGDWQNGKIYRFGFDLFTDNGDAIARVRAFPHVVQGGKMVYHDAFTADMEASPAAITADAQVSLSWSDDRGQTYGNAISMGMGGRTAGTTVSLIRRQLGRSRDRVYKLAWTFPYQTSLQGAFIETEEAET